MSAIKPRAVTALRRSKPRYAEVADQLLARIKAGDIKVGSMLPTEAELVDVYGVSRNTVREAMRGLEQMGLIERRPGAGTTLIAAKPQRRYDQVARSVEDLLQYGNTTHLVIDGTRLCRLSKSQARELDLAVGQEMIHVHGRRFQSGQKTPLCVTNIFLAPKSEKLTAQLLDPTQAVYVIIKLLAPKSIGQVDQMLDAVNLADSDAIALGVTPGTAALRALRCYTDKRKACIAVAISLHPKNRFRYHSVLTHRSAK